MATAVEQTVVQLSHSQQTAPESQEALSSSAWRWSSPMNHAGIVSDFAFPLNY
jgi:hypothetical protein